MRRLRFPSVVALGIVLTVGSASVTLQGQAKNHAVHKLDAALRDKVATSARGGRERVIVRVRPEAIKQARSLFKKRGHGIKRFNRLTRTFVIDADKIEELTDYPFIETISTDVPLQADTLLNPPATQSVLSRTVGAVSAWTGAGVRVAVIDSGIEPSADFAGRITGFYDFTRGGVPAAPFDDYGHGTHVAGLIGGSGQLSGGAVPLGVVLGVSFVGLKALDATGGGKTSDVVAALEFARLR